MPKVQKEETCCGGCFCRFKCDFCTQSCCPKCPECCLDYGSSCICLYCVCGCVPAPCGCIFEKFSPFFCTRGHYPFPPEATIIKDCNCCALCGDGCTCGMRKGCSCTDRCCEGCCEGCCKSPECCKCDCCKCDCCGGELDLIQQSYCVVNYSIVCSDCKCIDAYGCHILCCDCVCPCVPICCSRLCSCWPCGHHYEKNEDGSYGVDDNDL